MIMKITRLIPLVCASVFVAVPALAASHAVGSAAPISLCGEEKMKGEKAEKAEEADKANKQTDKKDAKEEKKKVGQKASA